MNSLRWAGICCLLASISLVSCKSKKAIGTPEKEAKTVAAPTSNEVLCKSIAQNENVFSYYNATGKLDYKDENTSQELSVQIVMEKGQYLYLNVSALLGISVARILATPDSLVILDILHRKAIIADYGYVKKMTGADLKLENLQNLIVGNTLFTNQPQQIKADTLPQNIHVLMTLVAGITQKTLYYQSLKVSESVISTSNKNQEFAVRYTNVYTHGSNLFPSAMNINIRAEKKMESQLELKTFVFEKKKEIQFSIPKSYERVRL